jgi:hypothetical protein
MAKPKELVRIEGVKVAKPRLVVAANDNYADKDLEYLHEVLSERFEVKTKRYEEFRADYTGSIIMFIFYGITSGFFLHVVFTRLST